jgi:RNA recognition motif-containing protein
MPKTELFVGNLDRDVQRKEIEDAFEKYGKILRCDIKNKGKVLKKAHVLDEFLIKLFF